jgi:Transglutaminase-like superfamily
MSARLKRRRLLSAQPAPARSEPVPSRYGWLYPFTLGTAIASVIVFIVTHKAITSSHAGARTEPVAKSAELDFPTLGELAGMSDDELRRQDLALVNLRCAEGLPGSEKLDIQKCLATLNQWTQRVRAETERHLYRAHDPRYAKHYRNSEAYLRASMMIQVLQQDCGIHYNKERIRDIDFTKSQDLFINGMVGTDNGGTCVSMPVLYTVVARRLGYPVFLVTAKAHVFCRWDDGKERFNI